MTDDPETALAERRTMRRKRPPSGAGHRTSEDGRRTSAGCRRRNRSRRASAETTGNDGDGAPPTDAPTVADDGDADDDAIATPTGSDVQPVRRHPADRRRAPDDRASPSASPRGTGTSRTRKRRHSSPAYRPRPRSRHPAARATAVRPLGRRRSPRPSPARSCPIPRARRPRTSRPARRSPSRQRPMVWTVDHRRPGCAGPDANARSPVDGCRDRRARTDAERRARKCRSQRTSRSRRSRWIRTSSRSASRRLRWTGSSLYLGCRALCRRPQLFQRESRRRRERRPHRPRRLAGRGLQESLQTEEGRRDRSFRRATGRSTTMWMRSCSCRKWASRSKSASQNAAFIGTTGDERLTLVTCWPYARGRSPPDRHRAPESVAQ